MTRAELRFVTRRDAGGSSRAPYDALNLGSHVGDVPEAVAANRAALARSIGLPADRVRFMQQVHGSHVEVVTGPSLDEVPATDALVTTEVDLALAVLVADCLPVLLVDAGAGVVAAAHAGRLGVAGGVVAATVEVMRSLGAGDIRARVGPGVCSGCYEVPAAMRDEVAGLVPATAATTRQGTPSLDLRAGVVAQLRALGIEQVTHDPSCTLEDPDLFSHRRDGVTGRFAGVVVLRD